MVMNGGAAGSMPRIPVRSCTAVGSALLVRSSVPRRYSAPTATRIGPAQVRPASPVRCNDHVIGAIDHADGRRAGQPALDRGAIGVVGARPERIIGHAARVERRIGQRDAADDPAVGRARRIERGVEPGVEELVPGFEPLPRVAVDIGGVEAPRGADLPAQPRLYSIATVVEPARRGGQIGGHAYHAEGRRRAGAADECRDRIEAQRQVRGGRQARRQARAAGTHCRRRSAR